MKSKIFIPIILFIILISSVTAIPQYWLGDNDARNYTLYNLKNITAIHYYYTNGTELVPGTGGSGTVINNTIIINNTINTTINNTINTTINNTINNTYYVQNNVTLSDVLALGFNTTSQLNTLYYSISNPTNFVNLTSIINSIGNWSKDKSDYLNSTQVTSITSSLQTNISNVNSSKQNIGSSINASQVANSTWMIIGNPINASQVANATWIQLALEQADNNSLWANKLNYSDQRYNETGRIDTINSTKAGLGTCVSGTVVQNLTSTGPQCITDQTAVGGGVTSIAFTAPGLTGGTISTSGTVTLNDTYANSKWNDTILINVTDANEKADNTSIRLITTNLVASNLTAFNRLSYLESSNLTAFNRLSYLEASNLTAFNRLSYLEASNLTLNTKVDNVNSSKLNIGASINASQIANATWITTSTKINGSQVENLTVAGDGTGGWTNYTGMTSTQLNVNLTNHNISEVNYINFVNRSGIASSAYIYADNTYLYVASLSGTSISSGTFIGGSTGLRVDSGGDIWTTSGTGDLWLGNSTQGNAKFQANATGNVIAANISATNLYANLNWSYLQNAPTFLTSSDNTSLWTNKLNVSDTRYNDSAFITSVQSNAAGWVNTTAQTFTALILNFSSDVYASDKGLYYNSTSDKLFIGTKGDFDSTATVMTYGDYDSYRNQSTNIESATNDNYAGYSVSTSRGTGSSPSTSAPNDFIGGFRWYFYNTTNAYTEGAYMESKVSLNTTSSNIIIGTNHIDRLTLNDTDFTIASRINVNTSNTSINSNNTCMTFITPTANFSVGC